ncbi:MAG: hypothetical protein WBA11_05140, partial [Rubrivirga sp.]
WGLGVGGWGLGVGGWTGRGVQVPVLEDGWNRAIGRGASGSLDRLGMTLLAGAWRIGESYS